VVHFISISLDVQFVVLRLDQKPDIIRQEGQGMSIIRHSLYEDVTFTQE